MRFFPPDAPLLVEATRIAWFSGTYGGYKTALAVAVAAELLERHEELCLYSNVPIAFADPPPPRPRDAVFLLDEGGALLSASDTFFLIGLRKANSFLLLPSVFPPPHWAQFLTFSLFWDLTKLGVPFCIFQASLRLRSFYWDRHLFFFFPLSILGTFDSDFLPRDDAGLKQAYASFVSPSSATREIPESVDFEEFARYVGGKRRLF